MSLCILKGVDGSNCIGIVEFVFCLGGSGL